MKKTLSLMVGALLVAMLPMGNVKAQNKTVQVEVRTLDRAALVSAVIYGDTLTGRTYFVDSALLDPSYTGSLVLVDTLPYSQALTIGTDGYTVTGTVDSSNFSLSTIVMEDANGIVYVVGNVAGRAQGTFQASNLFFGTTTGLDLTGLSAITAMSNMLTYAPAITTSNGDAFNTLKAATAIATSNDSIFVNTDMAAGTYDTILNASIVKLNNHILRGSLCVAHTTGTVVLTNGKINIINGSDNDAPITLKALDSVGSFNPSQHVTTIESGNYMQITPASGANITIIGGKFGANYQSYCANRRSFTANTDADATVFPYKVVDGYTVTWVDYDHAGNIMDSVYNESDNKIRPRRTAPSYFAGTDTILIDWYIDPAYNTPWSFLVDTLSSDTTLYARWKIKNSSEVRYFVAHHLRAPAGQIIHLDTIMNYDTLGNTITLHPHVLRDYYAADSVIVIPSLAANDTVVDFFYNRNSFQLNWILNGGSLNGAPETVDIPWGDTIDYSNTPTREGHTFAYWYPNPLLMPRHNQDITANYTPRTYGLTWTGVGGTTTADALPVAYAGAAITTATATYTDDNGNSIAANLHYVDNATGAVSSSIVELGTYKVIATSPDSNYHFNADTVRYIKIVHDTLTVTGTTVEAMKIYDANYTATVINPGTLQTVHGSDVVNLTVSAQFTDATPGDGKTIVAHYTISGPDANKYVLDTAYAAIVVNSGVIMAAPTGCNNVYTGSGSSAGASLGGFCDDTATIILSYPFTTGLPDQYSLTFSSDALNEGFADITWVPVINDTIVQFVIPANAASKDYSVQLKLRQAAYTALESTPITINFHVNMNKDYVVAIFNDVLTIVNKGEMTQYDQYRWYHDGVYTGVDGQYYKEASGSLTGTYHVELRNSSTGATTRTCPQDILTVPTEDNVFDPIVNTYPNPSTDNINVSIDNSTSDLHTLRVMNIMGQTMVNTTFSGSETSVNMSSFARGTYTVTVDGITVRVIKK